MNTATHTSVLRTIPLRRQRAKISRTASRRRILCTGIAAALVCAAAPAFAASATWLLDPVSNDWNNASNWTAGGPPNSFFDTATFNLTANPALRSPTLSGLVNLRAINFLAGADAFTITLSPDSSFVFDGPGTGITNNSGITQNFVINATASGHYGTIYFGNSTAGNQTVFTNSGIVVFDSFATAGHATFINNGNSANNSGSGPLHGAFTEFDFSTAGNGTFINNGGTASGALGGGTFFYDQATAGSATLVANGGSNGGAGGSVEFRRDSTGGTANVQVNGASVNNGSVNNGAGNFGGSLKFFDSANAGNGTFTTNGGTTGNTQGGSTDFYGHSSAGSGTFTTNAGTGAAFDGPAGGGTTSFHDTTTAGSANFTTNGTSDNNPSFLTGPGSMVFWDSASAGNATFTTNGASGLFGAGGKVSFRDNSTAANATFTTNAGIGPSAPYGGSVTFSDHATAANATFTMNGGQFPGGGGGLFFEGHATAANANITMNGGTSPAGAGGQLEFSGNATAGSATITNLGGTGMGYGGTTRFNGSSGAGNATLTANGGGEYYSAGRIDFVDNSTGDTAKVRVDGIGNLGINYHNAAGVAIGSLEGDGNVFLGANNLTVGTNHLSTTFSGRIQDGGFGGFNGTGGSFTKTGTGTLTLTGSNSYTGGTTVAAGTLFLGDSIAPGASLGTGDVTVNADATFKLELANSATFANKIVNTGHVVADTATGNNYTMSGLITGPGDFAKTGVTGTFSSLFRTNAVTLSHVNDYTGNTSVQQGTLRAGVANPGGIGTTGPGAFGNNSAVTVSGSGVLELGGNHVGIGSLAGDAGGIVQNISGNAATLTTGGNNTSTTFAGNIQDGITFLTNTEGPIRTTLSAPLSLWKTGGGTQTLTSPNSYTGGTTLAEGTLAAGHATAFGNGNLTMTGGTLRTTGPLSVNLGKGNILFTGGTYAAKIGGTVPGVTHDQLVTTGSANISGGMIALLQQNGFLLKAGNQIVLLSAASGVAGGTANGTAVPASGVTGLSAFSISPLLIPVVNLYTTSVVLETMQGSFAGLSGFLGLTPNQTAVAAALDSLIAQTGGKTGIFKEIDFLDNQSLTQLRASLDRISPEELTSIFDLTKSLANIQSTNIQRRLEEIRNSNAADIAALGGLSGGGGAPGPVGKRAKEIPMANEERWGLWFTGSGEFTHVGSTTNAAGFNLDSGGVTAGVDYRFTDHFAAGISLGYMNTTASLSNGGKIDADGGRVGAYATYFDRGFYLDAAVSGGFNSYNTRRTMPDNTAATGKTDGAEINVLLATGYDWKWKGLTLGPTASFQYTNVQLDGFTETGTFAPLRIAGQTAESLRSALGFHITFDRKVGRWDPLESTCRHASLSIL